MEREVDRTARFVTRRPNAPTSTLRSYLVVLDGKDRGRRLEIGLERTIVGRGPAAGFRLDDAGVSSVHFACWCFGDEVRIEELGSSNGTTVDGVALEGSAALRVGAVVAIGKSLLRHEKRDPAEVAREAATAADLSRAAGYVASILPPPIADGPLRISWRYLPSDQLGGDVFGYRFVDEGRLELFLLDVSGHGTEAALHAVSAANALRHGQLAHTADGDPSRLLAALNAVFPMERHGGLYLTAWYGRYDLGERILRFASAGHPSPLLKSADGTTERLVCRNPPIGMMPGVVYRGAERTIAPGSRLYLMSDGVFEIATDDGVQWGFEQLAEIVARPSIPGLAETARIETDVRAALPGSKFDDDFSLVVVELD